MRTSIRGAPVWLGLALLGACASASSPPPELQPVKTGQVEVTVTGFENDTGQVLMSLYVDETGWPNDPQTAFAAIALPIRGRMVVTEFTQVPVGPFAVAAFHDEDLDEDLDQNFLGMPTEDYGFSRDARGTFGPPSFDDARLEMTASESKRITIQVR